MAQLRERGSWGFLLLGKRERSEHPTSPAVGLLLKNSFLAHSTHSIKARAPLLGEGRGSGKRQTRISEGITEMHFSVL